MPAILICSCDELPFLERVVRNYLDLDSHWAERAAAGAERRADLIVSCGTEGIPQRGRELLLTKPIVATNQRKHDTLSHDNGHRLRRGRCVDLQELGERFDGGDIRR